MGCCGGNPAGTAQIQNSGSEEELQILMDQRKRKRKESNRESAKRSRMKKQKHLDDLTAQVAQLRKENQQILTDMNLTRQKYINVEGENSVLRAQIMELSERLQSLNDMLGYMNSNSTPAITNNTNSGLGFDFDVNQTSFDGIWSNPWNFMIMNQHITASVDLFQR